MRHRKLAMGAVAPLGGAVALVMGVAVTPAAAQTVTPVACDPAALQTAVNNANSGDILSLASDCEYDLTDQTGSLTIPAAKSITILGHGDTITRAADATTAFRIIDVVAGAGLDIREVTISNGDAGQDIGGGIRNDGTLTVTQSEITGNTASAYAGIAGTAGSTTTVNETTVDNNTATGGNGGGLGNDGAAYVNQSEIEGNSAQAKGGGVANTSLLKVIESGIDDNQANDNGGGLANLGAGATAVLVDSQVTENSATNPPGGIDNEGGAVTLFDTEVSGNSPTDCDPSVNCPPEGSFRPGRSFHPGRSVHPGRSTRPVRRIDVHVVQPG